MKESIFLTLVFALVGCGYLSQANDTVRVVDGDTIEWNNKMIRIAGIDAPKSLIYDENKKNLFVPLLFRSL